MRVGKTRCRMSLQTQKVIEMRMKVTMSLTTSHQSLRRPCQFLVHNHRQCSNHLMPLLAHSFTTCLSSQYQYHHTMDNTSSGRLRQPNPSRRNTNCNKICWCTLLIWRMSSNMNAILTIPQYSMWE